MCIGVQGSMLHIGQRDKLKVQWQGYSIPGRSWNRSVSKPFAHSDSGSVFAYLL